MKTIKRAFTVLLAVVMLVVCIPFASSAASTNVPTVCVQGYGSTIYKDNNDINSEIIAGSGYGPGFMRDDTIGNLLNGGLVELLMGAIVTGDYTEFNDYTVETLLDGMSAYALDDNGEVVDGSGNDCASDLTPGDKMVDGKYGLYTYTLVYDWRLDNFTNAERLHNYIQHILDVTGYEKVNLIGRCLGANIVLAYLDVYGTDLINAIEFYVPGFYGFEYVGAIFSGEIVFEPDAIDRYVNDSFADDDVMSLVKSLVSILNYINGLDLPVMIVSKIYDQFYSDVLPRVLMGSLGTTPAFWSFVGDYYDAAKELNFSTQELKTKYAGLIEKIDRFKTQIYDRKEEIIQNAIDDGTNIYIFAKYGFAVYPIVKEARYHNDTTASIMSSTLGATSTVMGETFSKKYIKEAKENGTYKFISPDNCVDLSTAFLPTHTWVIKGSSHTKMPASLDEMMAVIFDANGYGEGNTKYISIDDFEQYPQFLKTSSDDEDATLSPLTSENVYENEKWSTNIWEQIINLFTRIINLIIQAVKGE